MSNFISPNNTNKDSIPEFSSDITSIMTALRVMKRMLEELTGQRGGSLGAPRIFVQAFAPDKAKVSLKKGDLWIDSDSQFLNFYDGRQWNEVLITPQDEAL